MVHSDQGSKELRWDHAFACSVACLLVALDTFHTEKHRGDRPFVVAQLQTGNPVLEEAFPYHPRNRHLVEHCIASAFAAEVVLENEPIDRTAENVVAAVDQLMLATPLRYSVVLARHCWY